MVKSEGLKKLRMANAGIGQDTGLEKEKNILGKTHAFIDSHIRLIKNSVYVVAGVGIILIARSIRMVFVTCVDEGYVKGADSEDPDRSSLIWVCMTKVFTHIDHIPKEFISKHFKLLGRVTSVGDQGVLHVRHIPIIRLPLISKQKTESLPIFLACINVSPHGRKWLVDNVQKKDVWFTLLYSDETTSPARLYTTVQVPKVLKNTNVNEELIKQGLCRVAPLESNYSSFPEDKFLLKYLDRLIQLESQASHKKVGLWGSTDILDTEKKKHIKTSFKFIKSVITSPYNLFKWIFTKIKK